ncbi:MAG: hypothetical protein HOF76_03230 [Candidatus Scalindua sp.]|nr:hypothetical protein [Candidatus Scalindua sp.]
MLTLTRKPGESIKISDDNTNFLNIITIILLSRNFIITRRRKDESIY